MHKELHLNIADFNIMLDSGSAPMLPILDKPSNPFLFTSPKDAPNSSKNIDLIWHVKDKNFSVNKDMRELATFQGSSWRIFRNSTEETFIIPKSESIQALSWSLSFTSDFKNINICIGDGKPIIVNKKNSPINYIRNQIDCIILTHYLLKNHHVPIHAAAVEFNGKGYIFTGVSGAGKSSITKLFSKYGIDSWLSDEKVIIKTKQRDITVHGTPWFSFANKALNKGVPLAGIFFISHGADPVIKQLDQQESMVKLFDVASIPWYDAEYAECGCAVLTKIINEIPTYEFSYRLEENAVRAWQEFVAKHG